MNGTRNSEDISANSVPPQEAESKWQGRNPDNGQFAFEGNWGRKCVCGHELGVHSGEAPHDCMNTDRHNIMGSVNLPDWFDKAIKATACDCQKFRLSRKKLNPTPPVQS